jgi:cardiolipin synthase (CMP-forming)
MTIPNLITIARLCLVPVIVGCVASQAWQAAFWLFLAAGVSDGVDGFIAKRFNQRSELGAILDPLADKALLASLYVTLGIVGGLPTWLVILVVFRDVMIIAAVLVAWLLAQPIAIKASTLSKVNTAAQIVLVQFVLFTQGFQFDLPGLTLIGSIAVGCLTLASAAAYLRVWMRHVAGSPGATGPS